MASSMTMAAATFLAGSAASCLSSPRRRGLIVAKASTRYAESEKASSVSTVSKREATVNGRRDLVFAAAAAAVVATVAGAAMANDEEPKPGSAEAKKKYGPVCVTNPTARICRN